MIQLAMVSTRQGSLFGDPRHELVRVFEHRSAMLVGSRRATFRAECRCGWSSSHMATQRGAELEVAAHARRIAELGAP